MRDRSKNFDFFTDPNDPKKQKKSVWKKVWFWIKIVIYTLLFGVTITGLVQSCTVSSSNYTGAGVEFYRSKKHVAPYVATYSGVNDKGKFTSNKDEIIKYELSSNTNRHINTKEDGEILAKIHEQNAKMNGDLGETNVFSSLLAFDDEPQNVFTKNNKYIFYASKALENSKDGKTQKVAPKFSYESVYNNTWGEIKFFSYNWIPVSDSKSGGIFLQNLPERLNDGVTKPVTLKKESAIADWKKYLNDNVVYMRGFEPKIKTITSGKYKDKDNKEVTKTGEELVAILEQKIKETENKLAVSSITTEEATQAIDELKASFASITANKWPYVIERSAMFPTIDNDLFDQNGKPIDPSKVEIAKIAIGGSKRVLSHAPNIAEIDAVHKTNAEFRQLALFARDALQTLYDKTFTNKYYTDGIKKFVETYNIAPNTVKTMNDVVEYLNKEIDKQDYFYVDQNTSKLVGNYQETLYKYLKTLNYEAPITSKPFNSSTINVFDYSKGEINFNNATADLILRGDRAQRPIYDAAGYWKLGPFYGFFVWPLAVITQSLRVSMPNMYGWATIISISITVILTRILMLLITWKSIVNQSRQEDIKSKKAKIDAKYAGYDKSNKQMKARHQQEVAELYRKNNINPLDAFLTIIISMPVFLAIWRVIQGIPEIKSTHWAGIDFVATSWRELFNGKFVYLWILVVTLAIQFVSQYIPRWLTNKRFKQRTTIEEAAALKKANKTQNIVSIIFLVITAIFTAGVQVYWIIGGLWTIAQHVGIHYFKKTQYYKNKYLTKKAEV